MVNGTVSLQNQRWINLNILVASSIAALSCLVEYFGVATKTSTHRDGEFKSFALIIAFVKRCKLSDPEEDSELIKQILSFERDFLFAFVFARRWILAHNVGRALYSKSGVAFRKTKRFEKPGRRNKYEFLLSWQI